METIALILQTISVLAACWTIVAGIDLWRREFVGKRKIELAEEVLSSFYEIKDAVSFIRNPFSFGGEGKTRERNENESESEEKILDQAYVVFERYEKKKEAFVEYNKLKYRVMATFGDQNAELFSELNSIMNKIFMAANRLARIWRDINNGYPLDEDRKELFDKSDKYENIFWEGMEEDDEIKKDLAVLQNKIEKTFKPYFEEQGILYHVFTSKVSKYLGWTSFFKRKKK